MNFLEYHALFKGCKVLNPYKNEYIPIFILFAKKLTFHQVKEKYKIVPR